MSYSVSTLMIQVRQLFDLTLKRSTVQHRQLEKHQKPIHQYQSLNILVTRYNDLKLKMDLSFRVSYIDVNCEPEYEYDDDHTTYITCACDEPSFHYANQTYPATFG
jgi:hypothetical protein